MALPHRIKLKYFVNKTAVVDLPAFIPIFHRWIQENRMEELLIDVADYKHIPNGPGIMLVGHEADYAIDMGQGKPGFMYTRKRLSDGATAGSETSTLTGALRTIFRRTLVGCQTVEAEPALDGRIRFNMNEAELTFSDRLNIPNGADSYKALQDEVQSLVDEVYGDAKVKIEPLPADLHYPFALRLHAPEAPNIDRMLTQLS